jgi:outer membrane lipoprotein-sorting protein
VVIVSAALSVSLHRAESGCGNGQQWLASFFYEKGGTTMQIFLMVLLLSASPQEQDSAKAEKLYQAMAKKLVGAKTLQCSFEIVIELDMGKAKAAGVLAFAEGDKNRLKADGDFFGSKLQIEMISDGMKHRMTMAVGGQAPQSSTGDNPPKANEFLREGMARGGVFIGLFPKPTKTAQAQTCNVCLEQGGKIEDLLPISAFKLGKKENLGKRETQRIEYTLTIDKEPFAVTLWLDPETNLPLKRQLSVEKGKAQFQLIENYMNYRINEKIEAKEFALPK